MSSMFCHLHRKTLLSCQSIEHSSPLSDRYPGHLPGASFLRLSPNATSVRSQILPPVGATISNPAHLPTSTKVTPQTLQPIPSQPHPDHPLDRHRPASSNPANTSSSSQSASFPSIISASRFIIRTVHEQVKNQRKEEIRNHPKA